MCRAVQFRWAGLFATDHKRGAGPARSKDAYGKGDPKNGIHEVGGSIPPGSTITPLDVQAAGPTGTLCSMPAIACAHSWLVVAAGNGHDDARRAGSADPLVQVLVVDAGRNDERVARFRDVHGVLDGLEGSHEGATVISVAAGLGADEKGHGASTSSEASRRSSLKGRGRGLSFHCPPPRALEFTCYFSHMAT
jgi:hypothetical protein